MDTRTESAMTELPGVSIVIPNHNYERFIAAAIESALAQDHPRCEVIVVDDASTDGSRAVIERYADRVRTVFLPRNGGQVAALNAGWPLARHEILIFLDSDDLLVPHAASTIARNWRSGIAKIQFPMASIDAEGRPLHHVAPKYPRRLSTETLRDFLLRVGASPCTPGSGNAYAKWLLEKIAPIEGLMWMDAMLEVNAPFHGEVVTLLEPLALYRMHGSNWSQYKNLSVGRFDRQMEFFESKMIYLDRFCKTLQLPFDPGTAQRCSIWYHECQIAASRLAQPGHPRYTPPMQVVRGALRAFPKSPYSLKLRLTLLVWLTLVAVSPRRWAELLITFRFDVVHRPGWLEPVIRRLAS